MVLPDFPAGLGDPQELVLQALADTLGIDPATITLEDARRRAAVSFAIVGSAEAIAAITASLSDPAAMASGLSSQLQANNNISVKIEIAEPEVEENEDTVRPGEVWEEVNGLYLLRECGPGTLLVNSTIEDQECTVCLPKSYTLDFNQGCNARLDICFPRDCFKCPKVALFSYCCCLNGHCNSCPN